MRHNFLWRLAGHRGLPVPLPGSITAKRENLPREAFADHLGRHLGRAGTNARHGVCDVELPRRALSGQIWYVLEGNAEGPRNRQADTRGSDILFIGLL
jgi:hypothetical protein